MKWRFPFLAVGLLIILTVNAADAQTEVHQKMAVLASLKIRPYMDALRGMEEVFTQRERVHWDQFFLEADMNPDRLFDKIANGKYHILIAIGPQAMRFLWTRFTTPLPRKLFSMVMTPQRIAAGVDPCHGIALNLPVPIQLTEFKRIFPTVARLGLIYDPEFNAAFARQATKTAQERGLELVPMPVDKRDAILPVFRGRAEAIQALWMIPDATVISESIIPFIVKEGISTNIAIFGYNRYFIESGAAAALVRRYDSIGRQTAAKALRWLKGEPCQFETPDYEVVINPHVFQAVGLPVPNFDNNDTDQ